ncbi:MAG: ABC transporter ATP-binding protein, partial [Halanaerobiales bacterium]
SYANRILFLRDGKINKEIYKGKDSRGIFFEKILGVLAMMGGDLSVGC